MLLKEVIGGQPNNDEIELQKPSQAKEPEISSSVTSRFNPEFTRAEYHQSFQQLKLRKQRRQR